MTKTPVDPNLFLSFPETHRCLNIGGTSLKRLVLSGDLHPVHIGKRVLFHRQEVEAFAARLASAAGVPSEVLDDAS